MRATQQLPSSAETKKANVSPVTEEWQQDSRVTTADIMKMTEVKIGNSNQILRLLMTDKDLSLKLHKEYLRELSTFYKEHSEEKYYGRKTAEQNSHVVIIDKFEKSTPIQSVEFKNDIKHVLRMRFWVYDSFIAIHEMPPHTIIEHDSNTSAESNRYGIVFSNQADMMLAKSTVLKKMLIWTCDELENTEKHIIYTDDYGKRKLEIANEFFLPLMNLSSTQIIKIEKECETLLLATQGLLHYKYPATNREESKHITETRDVVDDKNECLSYYRKAVTVGSCFKEINPEWRKCVT